jgi:hypothetical protein
LITGIVLLFLAGAVPWLEVAFPTWMFVLSVYLLVLSFRREQLTAT